MDITNLCYNELMKTDKKNWTFFNRHDVQYMEGKDEDMYAYMIVMHMRNNQLDTLYNLVLEKEVIEEDSTTRWTLRRSSYVPVQTFKVTRKLRPIK